MKKTITKPSKKLIVANWKMNPTDGKIALTWFKKIQIVAHKIAKDVDTVICPPSVYLHSLQSVITDRSCVLGAQDCFYEAVGSYTGQISPEMVFNAKARYVILGHSEMRSLGETDERVNKKINKVLQYPLSVILCIGEKKRNNTGNHFKEVEKQLRACLKDVPVSFYDRIIITYEPVWAISTGTFHGATAADCYEMVTVIRRIVAEITKNQTLAQNIKMLYGGSANPENTESFLSEGGVQGLLVGKASLDPKTFNQMISTAAKLK
jgi:triosephosphate isomerase